MGTPKATLELYFCRECGEPKYETGSPAVALGKGRPRARELCCGHRIGWSQRPVGLKAAGAYFESRRSG
jgi:hypothetical protein